MYSQLTEQFMLSNNIAQVKFNAAYTQSHLPFAGSKMMTNGDMALADRILLVMKEMEGREYGKQTRLAEIAGCARAVVHHWLAGQTAIKYEHAKNIATKMGYRLEWIMEGKGPKRDGEKEEVSAPARQQGEFVMHLTLDELKIITHYRAANKMGKTMIELNAAIAPKDDSEPQNQ